MPYIIDGHNLIPHLSGISLDQIDDEMKLIELLQNFARSQRKTVEVFFDKAPPGQARKRRFGRVTAHFVHFSTTADDAIARRLQSLGRSAANWTVISSDSEVQATARAMHAKVQSSVDFARRLQRTSSTGGRETDKSSDERLSPEEVEEWLRLFGGKNEQDKHK